MQKRKLMTAIAVTGSLFAATTQAHADTGYTATFSTSITYMNVGASSATISLTYYAAGSSTPISVPQPNLAAGAATSISAGSISELPSGFQGSAVLSSDQPLAATAVQVSTGAGTVVKNRPLSNGFAEGSSSVLIATILKDRYGVTTRFAVQNAHTADVDVAVEIKGTDGSTFNYNYPSIPAGSSKHVDVGDLAEIPAGFSGSATVTAHEHGTSTAAPIAATAMELGTGDAYAAAFEGLTSGAETVYMPSAMCKYYGYSSFYAVQNTGASATNVTVTYKQGNATVATASATIAAGSKNSFLTCADGFPEGQSGSAVISADAGGTVVALLKVNGNGLTAVTPANATGAAKLALPYVRWTPQAVFDAGTRQRAYIAVQNVGGAAIAAGAVTVKYTDASGATVATQTLGDLGVGAKQSIKFMDVGGDNDFGYVAPSTYGGGAVIEGPVGSQLVAVVRIQSKSADGTINYGEDYNGIPVVAAP